MVAPLARSLVLNLCIGVTNWNTSPTLYVYPRRPPKDSILRLTFHPEPLAFLHYYTQASRSALIVPKIEILKKFISK